MNTTKLRIDLGEGVVEVEGTEEFVKAIYEDFRDQIASSHIESPQKKPRTAKENSKKADKTPKSKNGKAAAKKPGSGNVTGSMLSDLDLSGGGKVERLKDYFAKYSTNSNLVRNLIFVYYLQNELKISGITIDHVFTCYRDVGVKVPGALQQSLWDTRKKGWLDTKNSEDIKVTVHGLNYLEHDLPTKSDN